MGNRKKWYCNWGESFYDSCYHWLYFLIKARNSWKEILPEPSLSIWLKFHSTISWVIVMLSGLKVSSISFRNSPRSISSSSLPSFDSVFFPSVFFSSFIFFFESWARFKKKWLNYVTKQVHILQRWFYHLRFHQFLRNASPVDLGWFGLQALLSCRPTGL